MTDIKSMTMEELKNLMTEIGEKPFRAKQIYAWLHQQLVTSWDEMTNLSKSLREKLSAYPITALTQVDVRISKIDGTRKYLFQLEDGNVIESVLMRYHHGNSVCISSQVGCRMGCRFCASTQAGRVRDLTAGEIAAEIYTAQKDTGERVSHIVLMGIGEPMDNLDNVLRFLELVNHPEGQNIGMRHISLSTCGVVPGIDALAEKELQPTDTAMALAAGDHCGLLILSAAEILCGMIGEK